MMERLQLNLQINRYKIIDNNYFYLKEFVMPLPIHHIAYRVRDKDEAAKFFISHLNYYVQDKFPIYFNDDKTDVAQCLALSPINSIDNQSFCFLEPYIPNLSFRAEWHRPPEIFISEGTQNSIVGEWVNRKGPGIHHIAFAVYNIREVVDKWISDGIEFSSNDVMECDGLKQIFTKEHPVLGIVFELIETTNKGFCVSNVKNLMEASKIAA